MSTNSLCSFPLRRSHLTRQHGTLSPATVRRIRSQKLKTLTNAWPIEYRNKTLTRLFGSPRRGCYFLALAIFSFGILRDHLCVLFLFLFITFIKLVSYAFILPRYQRALQDQPRVPLLPEPYDTIVPAALFALGQTFVVTSTWVLGITGTFLGDYFGILMDHRVTG